jgi:hypothetical protein
LSGIEQSIARDGGIVNVCGKLLKAIIHHEQQAIFYKKKGSDRPGVTYFITQILWNRETRSDPSWSEETRSGASRSACCRLWLNELVGTGLDQFCSKQPNPEFPAQRDMPF